MPGGFTPPEQIKSWGPRTAQPGGAQGVSRILTINLNDVEKELHIK